MMGLSWLLSSLPSYSLRVGRMFGLFFFLKLAFASVVMLLVKGGKNSETSGNGRVQLVVERVIK